MHTTFISQVFRGNRELTPEQALLLGQYLSLEPREIDFWLALVDFQRAASPELKTAIERRLKAMQRENQSIKGRLGAVRTLSDKEKARFYSEWFYSGVRMATAVDALQCPREIAQRLALPLDAVEDTLSFLVDHGLVIKNQDRFQLGPARTHVESGSQFTAMHHRNWRLKAIERHPHLDTKDLAFSAPMTLSIQDLAKVRQLLLDVVQEVDRVVRESPSETLAFLNLDLIKF